MKMNPSILLSCIAMAVLVGCNSADSPKKSGSNDGAQAGENPATGNTGDDSGEKPKANETATTGEETNGVKREEWGTAGDGQKVFLFTLTNKNGTVCKLTNWGALISELHVRDKGGKLGDVVLGYESLERWLDSDGNGKANPSYFGCTVGRYCNRIANGTFELDGETYLLAQNNGPSHLHGGKVGWDKKVWAGEIVDHDDGQAVKFQLTSPDDDEGYPGNVQAEVIYVLTDDDALRIELSATTDKATPVNMTNHTYFNLAGEGSSTILDHELKLETAKYTEFGENDIPTGEIKSVEGTPFDFTKSTRIGDRIDKLAGEPGGYDQNYLLREEKVEQPALAATVHDPASGRVLEILTTEVGIQFYSGNYLDGSLVGKTGKKYEKHFGFCLEPQFHPDSPNKPQFPSSTLKPGERYSHITIFKFGVRE